MSAFPTYITACHLYVWCSRKSKEGIKFPETKPTRSCGPPCSSWQSNQNPLEEWPLLTTELSLQTWISHFFKIKNSTNNYKIFCFFAISPVEQNYIVRVLLLICPESLPLLSTPIPLSIYENYTRAHSSPWNGIKKSFC